MSTLPQDHSPSPVPGSCRQLVRGSHLRMARIALWIACLMTFLLAGVEFFTVESQFDSAIASDLQRLGGMFRVDQGRLRIARDRYVKMTRISAATFTGLGVALLTFSWLVYRFPLFCTLSGLILFLGVTITISYFTWYGVDLAAMVSRNWRSVAWELAIAVSLIMGVQAALLHQREGAKRVKELMEKLNAMMMA